MGANNSYNSNNPAFIFFSAGAVGRAISYSKFTAVLYGEMSTEDATKQGVAAVYLRISNRLIMIAATFLYIAFGAEGYADKNRYLPLKLINNVGVVFHLCEWAIALCCQMQGSTSPYRLGLRDPGTKSSPPIFPLIRDKAFSNRSGLFLPDAVEGNDQRWFPRSGSGGKGPEVFSSKQRRSRPALLQNEHTERLAQPYWQALDRSAAFRSDSLASLEQTYAVELGQKSGAATFAVVQKLHSIATESAYADEKNSRSKARISALRDGRQTAPRNESSRGYGISGAKLA